MKNNLTTKKGKLKIKALLTIISYIWLQALTLGFLSKAEASDAEIVKAINNLETSVLKALNSSANAINNQINSSFETTFKAEFDGSKVKKPSVLDNKIGFYANYFYQIFGSEGYPNIALNFDDKKNEGYKLVKKLLSQENGYLYQKSYLKKRLDQNELLAQPIEGGANDIERKYLEIPIKPDPKKATPYGSLDENSPTAKNTPNVADLIGVDSYSDEDQMNKAKLFLSYILQAAPPPKMFYIPNKSEAVNDQVTIYLPTGDSNQPNKAIPILTRIPEGSKETETEYDKMLRYLNTNTKYYQKYKMRVRATNMLRTIYLENLYRLYQERTKDLKKDKNGSSSSATSKSNNKTIKEREKEAALAGLSKKYYTDLKSKSAVDVNLEMLHSINKLVYFLYKLHEDNERLSLLTTASIMQSTTGQDLENERLYVTPITNLIENKCWNDPTKAACSNPETIAAPKAM